jgi:hypothetical protein
MNPVHIFTPHYYKILLPLHLGLLSDLFPSGFPT